MYVLRLNVSHDNVDFKAGDVCPDKFVKALLPQGLLIEIADPVEEPQAIVEHVAEPVVKPKKKKG